MAHTKTAAQSFEQKQKDINAEIVKLRANLKKHATQQKKRPEDWGFSGDLGYVLGQLRAINTFLK